MKFCLKLPDHKFLGLGVDMEQRLWFYGLVLDKNFNSSGVRPTNILGNQGKQTKDKLLAGLATLRKEHMDFTHFFLLKWLSL